ncbi:MAG: hypothetical protein SO050_04910 [Prevotella sp.]|nr:hypothetical protein [Prevotella sp.]
MDNLISRIDKDELTARIVTLEHHQAAPLDFDGILPDSKDHVHVVVIGTDRRMIFMLRQAALLTHYLNFDDETGANRTMLTLIDTSAANNDELKATKARVDGAGYLSNLTKLCPWRYGMWHGNQMSGNQAHSYLDIDLRIIGVPMEALNDYMTELLRDGERQRITVIAYKDILESIRVNNEDIHTKYFQKYEVPRKDVLFADTDRIMNLKVAKKINAIYHFSNYLGDIRACDIDNVNRYSQAIKIFATYTKDKDLDERWDKLKDLPLILSNVYCADGIQSKIRGFKCKTPKELQKIISNHLKLFAKCEHTRWNVEKLILGFREWNAREAYEYEFLYGSEAKNYKDRKKIEERAHIDICSSRTLRRIDLESVKYDNFFMLAIPYIVSFSQG